MSRENSYATLDADGQIPVDQLDNAPGSHPDLAAHNTLGLATQAELDAHATATHAATQAAAEATAAAALSGHAADTTAIHGIADTAALSLTSHDHDADYEAAGGIATHSADTTAVHGIADTAALSLTSHDHDADYEAAGSIATHAADTSSVHGITDTTVLATDAEVATAVATHAGLADPHPGYLTPAEGDAAYEATGAIATHSADTTAVHGIADTSVLATDAEVATAVSDHAAAANPHPTYLTAAEGDAAYEATGAVATHAGLADPHTGYRLESADHSHASTGLQAGQVAHTALTAVGVDDHHARDHAVNGSTHTGTLDDAQIPAGIARDAEVTSAVGAEATARDAAIATHAGLADPHTGYRLESADHTHATTGLQAGQVAHSALSGITANDHHNQAHVITGADHTMSGLTIGHVLTATSATAAAFSAPAAGGGEFFTTPADFAINNVADQNIATRTVTGIAAGDQLVVDAWFTILNNSTATRVITLTLDFDGLFDIELATGALATSATLIHPMKMSAVLDVRSTSLAYAVVQLDMQLLPGIASGTDTTSTATLMNAMGWGTSASNATGSTDVTLRARSANATATQTLRLHHFRVQKVTPN